MPKNINQIYDKIIKKMLTLLGTDCLIRITRRTVSLPGKIWIH